MSCIEIKADSTSLMVNGEPLEQFGKACNELSESLNDFNGTLTCKLKSFRFGPFTKSTPKKPFDKIKAKGKRKLQRESRRKNRGN